MVVVVLVVVVVVAQKGVVELTGKEGGEERVCLGRGISGVRAWVLISST